MDIKIYIDGELDRRHEMQKTFKKAAWTTFVWLDCFARNKRFPNTPDEKEKAHSVAMSFARGQRRPF